MSVLLPHPRGGDSEATRTHLPHRSPKTRNPEPLASLGSSYPAPIYHAPIDLPSIHKTVTQAKEEIAKSKELCQRSRAVRARLMTLCDDRHKVPPDPDPRSWRQRSIVDVKDRLEGRDELAITDQFAERHLKPMTSLNSWSNQKEENRLGWPISSANGKEVSPHPTPVTTAHSLPAPIRCSIEVQMASDGGKGAPVEEGSGTRTMVRDGDFRKRAGKQVAGSEESVTSIVVVDMARARQAVRPRFMAVGLFLSVLLASSQQVLEHMKRVWKVRGQMEANQVENAVGQRWFILEFTEQGDRDHVVRGGPWQYRGDVFLVEGLQLGADHSTALFTHVPMWVQFRGIPFYLVAKKLARELGEQVGSLVKIDEHARGDICDKFLRARIQLPLYLTLQKEITLKDVITDEQVPVQIRYEHIPNFFLFCGYIGHMEARCDTPAQGRKVCFGSELRVRPVHFEDPRTWFLLKEMGKPNAKEPASTLWRAPTPVPWPAPWTGETPAGGTPRSSFIGHVAEEMAQDVARLRVGDLVLTHDTNTGARTVTTKALTADATTAIISANTNADITTNTVFADHGTVGAASDNNILAAPQVHGDSTDLVTPVASAPLLMFPMPQAIIALQKSSVANPGTDVAVVEGEMNAGNTPGLEELTVGEAATKDPAVYTRKNCKRAKRVEKEGVTVPGMGGVGTVRPRNEEGTEVPLLLHASKKFIMHVPALAESLGEEGLRQLQNEEVMIKAFNAVTGSENVKQVDVEKEEMKDGTTDLEAGLSGAGPLPGANGGAWQGQ